MEMGTDEIAGSREATGISADKSGADAATADDFAIGVSTRDAAGVVCICFEPVR